VESGQRLALCQALLNLHLNYHLGHWVEAWGSGYEVLEYGGGSACIAVRRTHQLVLDHAIGGLGLEMNMVRAVAYQECETGMESVSEREESAQYSSYSDMWLDLDDDSGTCGLEHSDQQLGRPEVRRAFCAVLGPEG
jgi:hypothetical protein